MNDYWNDPPDYPEPPECCGDIMDVDQQGIAFCSKCGKRIEPEPEPELTMEWKEDDDRMVNFPSKCPHGNEWFDCDACNKSSDIAYDIYREKIHFGR